MRNMHKLGLTAIVGLAIMSSQAMALEQGEHRLNGFGTLGVNHLGGEADGTGYGIEGQTKTSWRGDQLSKLGGQVSYGVTDDLTATLMLLAKAKHDSWELTPEWAYFSYKANDNVTLRAGRMGTNFYMYSETINVGFTYPWLSLPNEVYDQAQFSNTESVDMIYTRDSDVGQITFHTQAGQAKGRDYYFVDDMHDVDYEDFFSSSLQLSTKSFGNFRFSYAETDVTTDIHPLVDVDQQKAKYTALGHRFDNGSYLTSSEITRLVIEGDGKKEALAYYIMGGHRIGDFLGHVTYAERKQDGKSQDSWTVGLNYSLLPNATVKTEYKRVSADGGYGSFDNSFADRRPGAEGRKADILSVGIDFVF